MTITFYTNFINHHQVPLADEFYKLLGKDYKMVTFEPLPMAFKQRGYADYSWKPYLVQAFQSDENMSFAKELADNSDIVILGAAPEWIITNRLKKNQLTFRYMERLFKKIDRRILSFNYWKNLYNTHTRYRNKNLYVLAASAYNRIDTALLLAYPHKVFKWGYFINSPQLNIQSLLQGKQEDRKIQLLWCGTLAQVKRPDLAVRLAYLLKQQHINAHINMVGSAEGWIDIIKTMIQDLNVSDYVSLLGNFPNEKVLQMMQEHHIFIFTSDKGEGWGVVLSEAMANGCTIVASNRIGAAPFLIQNNENGLLFQSGDVNSLFKQVIKLIKHPELRTRLSVAAYETMSKDWSPYQAACNFLALVDALLHHKQNPIQYGPCSMARIVKSKQLLKA